MFVQVIDNNTNEILTQANANNWAKMMVTYIDTFRRQYNNATVEWYYGETANGKPATTYKTFN